MADLHRLAYRVPHNAHMRLSEKRWRQRPEQGGCSPVHPKSVKRQNRIRCSHGVATSELFLTDWTMDRENKVRVFMVALVVVIIAFLMVKSWMTDVGGCGCPTTCTVDGVCQNGCCFNHEICNEPPYGNDSLNVRCDWGCP